MFYDLPESVMADFQRALRTDPEGIPTDGEANHWKPGMWFVEGTESPSRSHIVMSTTGVAFLIGDSDGDTARTHRVCGKHTRRVCSKQAYSAHETATNPLEVHGTVHFVDTRSQQTDIEEETQLAVFISFNTSSSPPSSSPDGSDDLLAVHVGSSGVISCKTLPDVSKQICIPSSQACSFGICNIGIGRTPKLTVSTNNATEDFSKSNSTRGDDANENILECETLVVPHGITSAENLALCVSFGKLGVSKDLFVENFTVNVHA